MNFTNKIMKLIKYLEILVKEHVTIGTYRLDSRYLIILKMYKFFIF